MSVFNNSIFDAGLGGTKPKVDQSWQREKTEKKLILNKKTGKNDEMSS
jgi:hypothetical protein